MREKVLYLFYSRSCSLVEKALFVFTFCFLRARVCAQDADKIHSLLLLLLLLGTYHPREHGNRARLEEEVSNVV